MFSADMSLFFSGLKSITIATAAELGLAYGF